MLLTSTHPRTLTLCPRLLSNLVVTTSSTTILTSLLLTQFYPKRFHIHPIPYLSDAGLRDPERFILSLGIQFSVLCFLMLTISVYLNHRHKLANLSLLSGVIAAFSLTTFTTVPGWWAPHHIFASLFAASAALWCLCCAKMDKRRRTVKMILFWTILVSFATFAGVWGLIKLQIPYKLIPNKDPRFVILAVGEYIGTGAFLTFVGIVGRELQSVRLVLSLRLAKEDFQGQGLCD